MGFFILPGCPNFRLSVKPVNGTEDLLAKAPVFKCLAYKVNTGNKVFEIRIFKNSPEKVKFIFFEPEVSFSLL